MAHIITQRKALGNKGEELAAQALIKQGFKIEQQNYTLMCGEIDIIARKGELLVFVEVKTRTKSYADFDLSNVISFTKQRKIIMTAKHYLAQQPQETGGRFDVALIEPDATGAARLTYIQDAFREEE